MCLFNFVLYLMAVVSLMSCATSGVQR
jgi:hypothetical protein